MCKFLSPIGLYWFILRGYWKYFSLLILGILNKEKNIVRAIDRVSYNGNTNSAAYLALQRAYRRLFTAGGGSRSGAVKVSDLALLRALQCELYTMYTLRKCDKYDKVFRTGKLCL